MAKLRQFATDHKTRTIWAVVTILILIAFLVLAWRNRWEWTGFFAYTTKAATPAGTTIQTHPGKTLWDLLDLLIIPLVLIVGGFLLNRAQRKVEREIARDREEERALQSYLEAMTELHLEPNNLRASEDDAEVRSIARSRTLTVLGDHSRTGATG